VVYKKNTFNLREYGSRDRQKWVLVKMIRVVYILI